MSKFNEQRLVSCVGNAVRMVNDGTHSPDQAIAKAASDIGLHPDSLQLVVNAYNVGKQAQQREKCAGEGMNCVLNEYPVARVDNVRDLMYPSRDSLLGEKKAAAFAGVSSEYLCPPTPVTAYREEHRVKVASATLPVVKAAPAIIDSQINFRRQAHLKMAAATETRRLDVLLEESRGKMLEKVSAVRVYLRKPAHARPTTAELEFNSRQFFGAGVTELFDYACRGLKEARAGQEIVATKHAAHPRQEPYALVKAALEQVAEYLEDRQLVADTQQKIASAVAKLDPFVEERPPAPPPSSILADTKLASSDPKQAGVLGSFASGAAGGMASSLRQTMPPLKSTSDLVSGLADDLSDPGHSADLKRMQSRAMLADMMNNDSVISGYDPAEITDAYNEITQLSPSMATQPAVIRSLLRKRLTGGVIEAFDAEQLTKLDSSLRSRTSKPIQAIPNAAA